MSADGPSEPTHRLVDIQDEALAIKMIEQTTDEMSQELRELRAYKRRKESEEIARATTDQPIAGTAWSHSTALQPTTHSI